MSNRQLFSALLGMLGGQLIALLLLGFLTGAYSAPSLSVYAPFWAKHVVAGHGTDRTPFVSILAPPKAVDGFQPVDGCFMRSETCIPAWEK